MVKKIGQRKFLLKAGYSNEELDKMSPGVAHNLIRDINMKRARERKKQREQVVRLPVSHEIKEQVKRLFGSDDEEIRASEIMKQFIAIDRQARTEVITKFYGYLDELMRDFCDDDMDIHMKYCEFVANAKNYIRDEIGVEIKEDSNE